MNLTQNYQLSVTASAITYTSQIFIGQHDVAMLFVPRLSTWYRSGVAEIRLRGSYASTVSAITSYFYDYSNQTPKECVVTISTGGFYEIPTGGGPGHISLQFDTTVTNTTTLYLMTSRISY